LYGDIDYDEKQQITAFYLSLDPQSQIQIKTWTQLTNLNIWQIIEGTL
jgi:hypothetical protein